MVTIIGNGMGGYNFTNIHLNLFSYDKILCDKNFSDEGENILKLSFKQIKEYILENYEHENILYVVSGSPLFFSAATLISNLIPKQHIKIINNTSSKTYLLEKLNINEMEVGVLSLHGRDKIDLEVFLKKQYTFILCDKFSLKRLQEAMLYLKENDITAIIGYKLGYADEKIEKINIFKKCSLDLSAPYVILIKREFALQSPICKDSDFKTQRGMITKEYKRHLSLQNLDLEANQLLWDVGAGSGSCGIEAYKRYKVKTVFFEKNSLRAEFIKENLSAHHVCDTFLHVKEASSSFYQSKEDPDRIFIGGGGQKVIEELPYLYKRLKENGVILCNVITLKHLNLILEILKQNKIEYELFSLSLTTYKGELDLIEPQRQLFQIKVKK